MLVCVCGLFSFDFSFSYFSAPHSTKNYAFTSHYARENSAIKRSIVMPLLDSLTISKFGRMRWASLVTRMTEIRSAHKLPVLQPEGKRPFGKWNVRILNKMYGGKDLYTGFIWLRI
jgi:hypothetical protein